MDKEAIKYIEEAEWESITLKLTRYAILKIGRLSWKNWKPPKGLMAQDIVQEAIVSLFEEKRIWNRTKYPDLYWYLKSVIDSKVSHLYKLKEYKLTQPFPTTREGQEVEELLDKTDSADDNAAYLAQTILNPNETLLEKEKKENDEAIINAFFEAIKGNIVLERVASLIMDGYTKPSEIAEQMGIEAKEVYNLQKRFRRKCEEFRDNILKKEN